ncbi:MAG: hypoxanthine phosphoribosyltransferase [Candidatus Neomarinimicrobiota bacterium]
MVDITKNKELYISKKDISKRIKEISVQISNRYDKKKPIFIGILNGSFIFFADLIRSLKIDCEVDFLKISSYEGKKSKGQIKMSKSLDLDIENRSIIIVEDIIDSGMSIEFVYNYISDLKPKDISIVSLLAKKSISNLNFKIDFIGFEISSEFVVGYGLDYNQRFRNLESIYKL